MESGDDRVVYRAKDVQLVVCRTGLAKECLFFRLCQLKFAGAEREKVWFTADVVLGFGCLACVVAGLWIVAVKEPIGAAPHLFVIRSLGNSFGLVGAVTILWWSTIAGICIFAHKSLPWIVLLNTALFVILQLLFYVLHPELDSVRIPMSSYANTPHGYLFTPTLILTGGLFLSAGLYLNVMSQHVVWKQVAVLVVGALLGSSPIGGVFRQMKHSLSAQTLPV